MRNRPLQPNGVNWKRKRDGVKSFLSFSDTFALTPALSRRETATVMRVRATKDRVTPRAAHKGWGYKARRDGAFLLA